MGVSACPTAPTIVAAALRAGAAGTDELVDLERLLRDAIVANDGGRFRDRASISRYLDTPVEIGTKLRRRAEAHRY